MSSTALAISATALALLVSTPTTLAAPQDANPDFSGRWAMERNVNPDVPRAHLLIKHKGPSFVVEWGSETPTVWTWSRTDFTTDGQENSNTLPLGAAMKSKSKWDGKELVIVGYVHETAESVTYRWALSADYRTLTLSMQTDGPQWALPTGGKFVYTRE